VFCSIKSNVLAEFLLSTNPAPIFCHRNVSLSPLFWWGCEADILTKAAWLNEAATTTSFEVVRNGAGSSLLPNRRV
jgi:hypothetical protein